MKILAFSDLHCDSDAALAIVSASSAADIVIGAGDFGIQGERSEECLNILTKIDCPLVLVSGNHDRLSNLQDYCRGRTGFHLLHGSSVEFHGINIFGLGGEIPKRGDADWNETWSEVEATDLLQFGGHYKVLVTHTPPYGITDEQSDGSHEGSESIRSAIESIQPVYCLCGHIHHSWGTSGSINKTFINNLGPTANWFTV